MSVIQPNGKIWLCKNVPLNPSMTDTLYFGSQSDRYNYFLNHSDINFTNVSYMRVSDGVIRLQVNPETVYNYNYMMFTNTGFSDRYFFAFITSVKYINNVTAEIRFELDPMITWFFDYHLKECYVEREHASTDTIGGNIVPEGFNFSNYIVTGENSYIFGSDEQSYVLVLVSGLMSSGTPSEPLPAVYAGTYCGLSAFIFDVSTQKGSIDTLILEYFGTNSDMVVAMFSVPYALIQGAKSTTNWHLSGASTLNLTYSLNGYTPRNKKLYTYPYNKCTVTDEHGTEIDLAFEFFDDPTKAQITIEGLLIPTPEIVVAPMHYCGMTTEYNLSLVYNDFPKLAWASDYFKEWYNQNVSKINASMTSNAVNSVGSLISSVVTLGAAGAKIGTLAGGGAGTIAGATIGATAGAIGSAINIGTSLFNEVNQVQAQMNSAERVSNPVHGTLGSSNMVVAVKELWQIGFFQKCFPAQILRSIDEYFDMYGYATKRVKTPNTWVRERWTYTKTVGCQIDGEIPAQDMETICKIYDNGIRFWWGSSDGTDVVGQFNLSNNVL